MFSSILLDKIRTNVIWFNSSIYTKKKTKIYIANALDHRIAKSKQQREIKSKDFKGAKILDVIFNSNGRLSTR